MKLRPYQQKVIDENPSRALVVFGTGKGKTLTAIRWVEHDNKPNVAVICPKAIKQKWLDDVEGMSIDVFTKEECKKVDLKKYDTLIIDEIQYFNSPLFTKARSKMTETIYKWLQAKPQGKLLGLTATAISSNPWNAHTLLTFTGHYIPWKEYREEYFSLESPPYMKGRYMYMPKTDWRKKARLLVEKYAYTSHEYDADPSEIPEQHHIEVKTKLTASEKADWAYVPKDPQYEHDVQVWHAQRKIEQSKDKIKHIKQISSQFSKVVIYAYYKEQVAEIAQALEKERQTYVMTGETKDQGAVIKQAQEDSECYFVIQADISEGYQLKDFPCMIFASQSFKKNSEVQAIGRIQRMDNIKENWYYYLVADIEKGKDKSVRAQLKKGGDFVIKRR